MPQFDARATPGRYTPAMIGCSVVLGVAAASLAALKVSRPSSPPRVSAPIAPPVPTGPVAAQVEVQRGETLVGAVQRTGLAPAEAKQVVAALGEAIDTTHIRAGLAFHTLTTRPHAGRPPRLMALSMKTGPVSELELSREPGGALSLRQLEAKVRDETMVAAGEMQGSLYESAIRAGATPTLVAEAVKLFAKKLDFARDIHPGDRFRLAFDRQATEAGRTVSTGDLLYAEVGVKGRTTRFYR